MTARETRPRVSGATGQASTVDAAQLVGSVLADRYRVVRLLGHGANGAVCEVIDATTQRAVALKLLVADDADLAARLEREGKALSMLAHQNIVELVDAGRLPDGRPYVVTELVRGVSLRDELDARVIEPRRALAIVRQLLEALHHAHAAGLIHRDIKPDNIMIAVGPDRGETVKLLDFGVAKVMDPNVIDESKLTRAGLEVFGTPAYMAPETAIGEPVDARTDLYSVGILLFELLTGRVPFDHDDPVTLMRKHLTDTVPSLREAAPDRMLGDDLQQLVSQALEKLPERRFQSAMAMHGAVQAALQVLERAPASWVGAPKLSSGTPLPTERPVLPSQPPSFEDHVNRAVAIARKQPAIVAGGAALLLLIIGLASSGPQPPVATVIKEVPAPEKVSPPRGPVAANAGKYLAEANVEYGKKRFRRAVAAYERALVADRSLARDSSVRVPLVHIAKRGDPVNAVVALELLARLDPPDTQVIAEIASTSKLVEVRHRAYAIAERDGFDASIDRYSSWSLDLWQGTCAERSEAIARLVDLGDARAVEELKKIGKALPCVAKEALAGAEKLGSR